MAYAQVTAYKRAPSPQFPGGERQYLERELAKLETTLRAIIAAINELRAKVP